MKLSEYKRSRADRAYCIAARFFGGTVLSGLVTFLIATNGFPHMAIPGAISTIGLLWFTGFYFFWGEELISSARDEEWLEQRNEEYEKRNTTA